MSKILFVCTANICRSPAAEAISRSRFAGLGHSFASAGFLYEGREAEPDMVKALSEVAVDASGHRSRIISLENAGEADVILTMEARHVQDIAVMSPDLFAKTLPLVEAQERLAGRRIDTAEFVAGLASRNPMAYFDTRWDVEDPYKRSKRKYRKSVEQIAELIASVVPSLS